MEQKAQDLERRLRLGESIFDIARSLDMDLAWACEIDKILRYQDAASELQIEHAKNLALDTLTNVIISADDLETKTGAAKALLQHYRDEKKRLESRPKEKSGPELLPDGFGLFGPWSIRSPNRSV